MGIADSNRSNAVTAYRASIFHVLRDPGMENDATATEYFEDGLLVIENGHVATVGPAEVLLARLPTDINTVDYTGKLIIPGFIDVHTHYPQVDVIAAYGEQLLEWLNKYTFPTEIKFTDNAYAQDVAGFFLDELLRNGTTTALIMATTHQSSVDVIFEASRQRNMRMLAGKVLMDRHAPDALLDTPETGYQHSKDLIEQWHEQDRLLYAITPRFAPTSSNAQLEQVGQLAGEYPGVYVHTHVAENKEEIAWVAELFPWSKSYLDVYDHYGLLRDRSIFAHCIHLNDDDHKRMAESGAAVAFCPTSNTFLGSGLFNLEHARVENIRVGLATDVGGGTSFNMLQTLSDAYKVQQLAGTRLSPYRGFYLATLGSAEALYLEDMLGNFMPGKEADFIVLDYAATPLIQRRLQTATTIDEKLFALMMLGDDRAIRATYIMGECAHSRD